MELHGAVPEGLGMSWNATEIHGIWCHRHICIQVDATNKKDENHLQNHEIDFLYLVAMYEHMGLKTHLYINMRRFPLKMKCWFSWQANGTHILSHGIE